MRAVTKLGATLLLGLTGLLAGCGGGGNSTPVTVEDFCKQKAQKECQVATRCSPGMVASCETARKAACMAFATANTVGPRVFKASNMGTCLNKTDSLYRRTDPLKPADLADVDDACKYVFQGSVANLETCTSKYDCKERVICDKGRCAPQVVKGGAALCGNPGEICTTGFYCTGVDSKTCVAKKAAGETCDSDNPCLESLRCSGGTCMSRVASGSACGASDDCVSTAPYCDPYAPDLCGVGLTFATNSMSCLDFITASTPGGGGQGGSGGGQGGTGGGTDSGAGGAGGSTTDAGADASAGG